MAANHGLQRTAVELSLIVSGPMSAGKAEVTGRLLAARMIPGAPAVIVTEEQQ